MVVARHIGRTGNNLFQIATALGYARKYGYQWGVDPGRGFGEPYSNIHQSFPHLPKAHEIHGVRYHEHPEKWCPVHDCHLDLCHFDHHEIPNMGPNVILSGFYQSWKYFEHCKEEVKSLFALRDYPELRDYVSIHVRRGDYVQNAGSFPPVSQYYIGDAIRLMHDRFMPVRDVVFFSDDIKWCKDVVDWVKLQYNLGFRPHFSEGRSEYEDLSMMASCSHHIISNSTFSWWAAYLGKNPDRVVISPSHKRPHWFGHTSGVKKDCVDLLPEGWIEIEWNK